MNTKTTFFSLAALLSANLFFGQQPTLSASETQKIPVGYEWKLTPEMSDEFDSPVSLLPADEYESTAPLDASKWSPSLKNWKGRVPAEFLPENVFLEGGSLHIKNRPHPAPHDGYTIGGGAVESKKAQTYGFFESRMKASKVRMSSTFWINTQDVKFGEPDLLYPDQTGKDSSGSDVTYYGCDGYSTEIDIIECMGKGDVWPTWMAGSGFTWDVTMASNTHFKRRRTLNSDGTGCRDKYETRGAGAYIDGVGETNVGDDYHVYAAWWINANTVHYYIDGKLVNTVNPRDGYLSTPFNIPMAIRMVTETYNWQVVKDASGTITREQPGYPDPTDTDPSSELNDPAVNTTYYDWTRTYSLQPIAENLVSNGDLETGGPRTGGWTAWGPLADNVTFTDEAGEKFTNGRGAKINNKGGLEQVITVVPNTDYVFTVMAKKMSGSIKLGVKEATGTVSVQTPINITSTDFEEYQLKFNSGARSKVKIFAFGNDGDTGVLDNFSVIDEIKFNTIRPTLGSGSVNDTETNTYINVNNKTISINMSNTYSLGDIDIYSFTGENVYEEANTNFSSKTIDTKLKTGVYILRISLDNGQRVVRKIIIN